MAKKYMKAAHTKIDYGSLDEMGTKALIARQGEELAAEASGIEINSRAREMALPYLPSVHAMLTNAYTVIDSEVRRLGRDAQYGLDKGQTAQFEKYVSSLVKLANLEHNIRDTSDLEAMSDSSLTEAVRKALVSQKKDESDD